jgi:hypothetical protein
MSELTKDQKDVLQKLAAKIGEIVAAAIPDGVLAATRVLDGGIGFTPADYGPFHRRFVLVHKRLEELMAAERVVVNENLSSSVAALTRSALDEVKVNIQLSPATVDPNSDDSITKRVLTLIHELSHALREKSEDPLQKQDQHPVKDYTYRGSWGQGYLAGKIGSRNADTYAEAAAQIAEKLENRPAGFYRETGSLPAQRRLLQQQYSRSGGTLGPALAWADIKTNRVWLRAFDLHIRVDQDLGFITAGLEAIRSEADIKALDDIEAQLQKWKILGARHLYVVGKHDADSIAAAKSIETYMADLKDRLKALHLTFPAQGEVTYDAKTATLAIPFPAMDLPPLKLADAIIKALLAAVTFPPEKVKAAGLLEQYKRDILDLLWANDRSYEKPQVQELGRDFDKLTVTGVSPESRGFFSTSLPIAEVEGLADQWAVAPARLKERKPSVLAGMDIFNALTTKHINRVAEIAQNLAKQESLPDRLHVVAKLRGIIGVLQETMGLTTTGKLGLSLIETLTKATDTLAASDPASRTGAK